MNLDTQKQVLEVWADRHKKGILIGMVLMLFMCLITLIAGLFLSKSNQENKEKNSFKKLKETTEKVSKTTKIGFNQAVDANELYKKASALMQKDSLTKEDYTYLKMVDSTFKSIMKQQ